MGLENIEELDSIFGPESKGTTPQERARSSSRIFVRSQVQLAENSPEATGRRLSAWEALETFGLDKLREVFEYSSAILSCTAEEPAQTLHNRREDLGLSVKNVAKVTGLNEDDVENAENPKTLTSIHIIEKIARALALDEGTISLTPGANGDPKLAMRLRTLESTHRSSELVSQLCEAAWVSGKQYELFKWLYSSPPVALTAKGFEPNSNYGNAEYPAWKQGYWLARQARKILGVSEEQPIKCMRELIEDDLEIPLVQTVFPETIAGATIANGSVRGITVNTKGHNHNVWVRRMTLAHELGHLLYDPDENLKKLLVDQYSDLEQAPWGQTDYVEQRANAFAVDFLAPQKATIEVFKSVVDCSGGLRKVMDTFGLSYTSARFHIWNGLDRKISLDDLVVDNWETTDEWSGKESFTIDYFKPDSVPISKRGRFACLVVQSMAANLLTEESAAAYLGCSVDDYRSNIDVIRDICGISDQIS